MARQEPEAGVVVIDEYLFSFLKWAAAGIVVILFTVVSMWISSVSNRVAANEEKLNTVTTKQAVVLERLNSIDSKLIDLSGLIQSHAELDNLRNKK